MLIKNVVACANGIFTSVTRRECIWESQIPVENVRQRFRKPNEWTIPLSKCSWARLRISAAKSKQMFAYPRRWVCCTRTTSFFMFSHSISAENIVNMHAFVIRCLKWIWKCSRKKKTARKDTESEIVTWLKCLIKWRTFSLDATFSQLIF